MVSLAKARYETLILVGGDEYLEDHPSKWFITMESCCPLSRVSLVINGLVYAFN